MNKITEDSEIWHIVSDQGVVELNNFEAIP